jgi:hypothetical protein
MAAVLTYLKHLQVIHESSLASKERSYYPALDVLFNTVGVTLTPKVNAIHDIADQGAGHPDYALQVEQTKDIRAAIEVKSTSEEVEDIMQSGQVKRYLGHYSLTLVTNLRDFALVRLGRNNQVEIIMRYSLAIDEATFWRTTSDTLARQHQDGLLEFLISALTWDATITRSKDLADALARYARETLRRLSRQQAQRLDLLREALSQALGLHFTDEQGEHFFRSSLVQTLFYSLFSAWVVWNRKQGGEDQFRWREAGDYLSVPVMRELFERIAIPSQLEMLDIRKPLEWAEATLRRTTWNTFVTNFDQGDAVNYFYEPFLEAYDPTLRVQLGVWYTPREIIRYQVARVDRLLREELQIPLGLADERVIVLDPATGTGGYLLEVLRVIDTTFQEQSWGAMRGMGLRTAATKRIFGFEILPAPFVVAHLQIATLLSDRGVTLDPQERAGVYLTNSLIGWEKDKIKQLVLPEFPALKSEAEAASSVKHETKILVVLGNPPYRGPAGVAEEEEHDLIAPYYVGLTERFGIQARSNNDLFIRFFRLAERQIGETTGRGIISYITNNSWLDNLSQPIMRERMVKTFDRIWIDNLNGGGFFKGSRGPDGKPDRSAFEYVGSHEGTGITVPTAIACMVKTGQPITEAGISYRNLWGQGAEKRQRLAADATLSTEELDQTYEVIKPSEAMRCVFLPGGSAQEYLDWPALDEIFVQQFPGFTTARDPDLISIDPEPLRERMQRYFDAALTDDAIAALAPTLMQDTGRFKAKETRRELLKTSCYREDHLVRVAYRPFDDRWLYWEATTKLLDRNRPEFFEQAFSGNFFLPASTKSRRGVNLPTITDKFSSYHLQDPYALYFPLFTKQAEQPQQNLFGQKGRQPNIKPALLDSLQQAYNAGPSSGPAIAVDLFYHILAVSRAPLYETENEGYIMQDWPRIPIPDTFEALKASATLGHRVADLLLPDVSFTPSPELRTLAMPTRRDGGQFVEADLRMTVRYGGKGRYVKPVAEEEGEGKPGRLWWNDVGYWDNVPPEVWNFTIGGYPVIKKWLDYRHIEKLGRPLRYNEVRYVSEIARRIATLIALGPSLDENYIAIKANTLEAVTVSTQAVSLWVEP